jgi:hypothetical protein
MSVKTGPAKRLKRRRRVRAKVRGNAERPRLSVFRSNKGFYVQLVDDTAGRTLVWEQRLAAAVWPPVSRMLPSFLMPRAPSTLLRSSTNGTWRPGHLPSRRVPVRAQSGSPAWDQAAALRFRDALAARGAQLVLMCVPNGRDECSAASMEPIARALGVRAVCPRVDGPLWMVDTSHMRPLSGKRFGRAFLRELGTLDVVRAIAQERS